MDSRFLFNWHEVGPTVWGTVWNTAGFKTWKLGTVVLPHGSEIRFEQQTEHAR